MAITAIDVAISLRPYHLKHRPLLDMKDALNAKGLWGKALSHPASACCSGTIVTIVNTTTPNNASAATTAIIAQDNTVVVFCDSLSIAYSIMTQKNYVI
jgi:hypothetical protein